MQASNRSGGLAENGSRDHGGTGDAEGGTKVTLRHRAVGLIDPQHREGVVTGWNGFLESVKGDFAKTSESAA